MPTAIAWLGREFHAGKTRRRNYLDIRIEES
jgi:hypothetical protein